MPELPEVEYTARQLRTSIIGATIKSVDVFWERTISHPMLPDFLAAITGRLIEGVRRRGKLLLLDLSGGLFLSIHRRMTGNLLLLPSGWEIDTSLRERDPASWNTRGPSFFPVTETHGTGYDWGYCRVCFTFTDERRLLYTDPRKFGRLALWPLTQELEVFANMGPEPLEDAFSVEALRDALMKRRNSIKQALLDQSVVAGVGNIYADEALYYAHIHPLRSSTSLKTEEIQLLHKGVIAVLTQGIEHGGTTFSGYRDLWGEAGDNYNHVRVYQQDGKPCTNCGTLIERIVIAQRSTHFCPGCQKNATADAIPTIPINEE